MDNSNSDPSISVGYQCCPRCKRILPKTPEYFHRKLSGFASWCKDCRSIVQRKDEVDIRQNPVPKPEIDSDSIGPGYQRCTGECGRIFPATPEYFHRRGTIGLHSICKPCRSVARRKYSEHRERDKWIVSQGTSDQCGACGAKAMSILGDTNETTHKPHGFLCMKCYKLMRESHEDVERILNVALYMRLTRKR